MSHSGSQHSHTADYSKNLIYIEIFTNSLSVIGSSFIVLMYICNKDLQSFAYKLVLLLSIADIIFGIGRMFNFEQLITNDYTPEEDAECYTQSFLVTYGGLSTIFATMAISWSLSQSVINGANNLDSYSKWYYLLIFFFPLLISIVPAATGDYGVSGISCWISDNGGYTVRTLLWRLFLFYIPLWVSILYNFINYYRICKFVESLFIDNSEGSKQHRQMIRKLTYYPLIMVICYLFATVNRIYEFFEEQEIEYIAYLHVALAGLQGFFNSLVYGFNKQVRSKLCHSCLKGQKQQKNKKEKNIIEYTSKSSFDSNTSREPPSRNMSSSIESSITAEDDNYSIQKEMRQNLGQDLYTEYDSHPGKQVFSEVKKVNQVTHLSEMSSINSNPQNNISNDQENMREINLR